MKTRSRTIATLCLVSFFSIASISEAQSMENESLKIRLKVGDKTLTATMTDSKTTRDFLSLLPLTLTMNDLFGREKYAHLPKAVSTEAKRAHKYEVGEIAYWPPGPDVAIYYRQDGERIPAPGIIVIGKIDSGVDSLNVAGPLKVTIESFWPLFIQHAINERS